MYKTTNDCTAVREYSHCAAGQFPYSEWSTPFHQLKEVVDGAAPRLPDDGRFSSDLRDMVALCLDKEHVRRPKYPQLLQHPFLQLYAFHTHRTHRGIS